MIKNINNSVYQKCESILAMVCINLTGKNHFYTNKILCVVVNVISFLNAIVHL